MKFFHLHFALFFLVLFTFPVSAVAQYWEYTVRPGDNLWNISEKYLRGMEYWRPLQRLNNVSRPRYIPPGSVLQLPIRWLKVQPAAVRVVSVQGDTITIDGVTGENQPLAADMVLESGDEVRTAANSSATLEFADGSEFLVQEDTVLELDTLSAYSDTGMVDTRLRLQRGRLDAQTAPSQGPATVFEVWTPASVSAVRGTEYRVAMETARQASLTEVVVGQVEVAGDRSSRSIPEGFGTVTSVGEPPSPPIQLLPPPDIEGLPNVLDRVPIQITIPPLEGAVAYRLQIATDPRFDGIQFDRVFGEPTFVGPDVPDGTYLWRVRGIDENGLEGFDSIGSVEVNARPEPPFLIRPNDGETIREPRPDFGWADPEGARAFHFQLATQGNIEAPLLDRPDHVGTSLTPESDLTPGFYEWRIATIDDSGEQGPFSDPQTFEFKPAPESPELDAPDIDDDLLTLRWRAGLPGQRYQVQLSRDPTFDDIILDRTVDTSQVEMARPIAGTYYLRVRTIDTDGFAGEYGTPQEFKVPSTSILPFIIVPLMLLLGFL